MSNVLEKSHPIVTSHPPLKQDTKGIVITQTPFRISFFGGGTDFPGYFNEHEGLILGTTIDKYLYVSLNSLERFYDKRIRLSHHKLEVTNDPASLDHPILRSILQNHPLIGDQTFIDINTYADLPGSSGMGSSSVFTVGMLNALYALNGMYRTAHDIAFEAIKIEREDLQEAGGWQDQIFAASGGFNRIDFAHNDFTVEPLCIPYESRKALESSCIMCFTGTMRSSDTVQRAVMTSQNEKLSYLHDIKSLAHEAFELLWRAKSPDDLVKEFGLLLHQSWLAKRKLSDLISTNAIENIYTQGLASGAIGGKLCGAGGGGFVLFIVPPEKQAHFAQKMTGYKLMPIRFSDTGSKVIYSKVIRGD